MLFYFNSIFLAFPTCFRMRLLLWLLLLIEMVPVFTLSDSFGVIPSLAGMVNPNLWLHLISKSLVMLTAAEGYSHPGQQDDGF